MAFIPIPNGIKVSLEFSWGSQTVVLTLGWQKGSAVTLTDLDNANSDAITWWNDFLKADATTGMSLVRVNSTDLTTESSPSVYSSTGLPVAGTSAGNATPNNAAAVITFGTGSRGRSYRGRSYFCGIPYSALDSSTAFSPTYIAALASDYSAGLAAWASSHGLIHSVFSRFHNGVARTTGISTPVTSYSMDANIDSQRRRLAGRGI